MEPRLAIRHLISKPLMLMQDVEAEIAQSSLEPALLHLVTKVRVPPIKAFSCVYVASQMPPDHWRRTILYKVLTNFRIPSGFIVSRRNYKSKLYMEGQCVSLSCFWSWY